MGGDWVWYLGAGVLGVGAVWLFVCAWLGDRSRGRARCGRCWYSMEGLVGAGGALPVCPECGWKGKRKGQMFKSRRRKGWVLTSMLIGLGAAASGMTPKAQRDGVWSLAPTWMMWGALRTGWTPGDGFAVELAHRQPSAYDIGRAGRRVYEWLPRVRLTRERGVSGVPLRGRFRSMLGKDVMHAGLRFEMCGWMLNDADVDAVQSHENWWTPSTHALWQSNVELGEANEFVYDVRCTSTVAPMFERESTFQWPVQMVKSLDEVMSPVALAGERFVSTLKPSVFVLPTTRNLALSVNDVAASDVGGMLALGVKVEVVRKGQVVAHGRWFQSPDDQSMVGRPVLIRFGLYDPVGNVNGPMTCTLDELVADGCIVRFSTDEEMALSVLECEKYWKGSFEVPLTELVK